ncbi:hypothetical protein [Umezawaea beigongshangensis]|uniref:hypothetical protein n=1 Tax=Umezawaea beigongshangensis TaxID=2780383 RepID=UPI0018F13168|nr:hypothetical protein [Umezawaea beigongshangensis]
MKIIALAATTVTALALTAGTANAAEFDFTDCPALPSGADPAEWRCEVLESRGVLSFGNVRDLRMGAVRLTFAEGRLDGEYAQVFGALRSKPVRVPGVPGARVALRCGGHPDFLSDDERKGEIDLAITVSGPLLPTGCTIGDEDDPIRSVLQPVGETEVVSQDPPTLRFATVDEQLGFPASDCGRWTGLLDHRLGLPSPSGANVLEQTTHVQLRSYESASTVSR